MDPGISEDPLLKVVFRPRLKMKIVVKEKSFKVKMEETIFSFPAEDHCCQSLTFIYNQLLTV